MKKKIVISFLIILIIGAIYTFLYKPLQRDPKKLVEAELEQFLATWNGEKNKPGETLADDVWAYNRVIHRMIILDKILKISDLSKESQSAIEGYKDQIRSSPNWLSKVEDQVGVEFESLDVAIERNALYMVAEKGQYSL